MAKSRKKKRRREASWKPTALPYRADYNDHFETPVIAYRDILPLLDCLQEKRDDHVLYDPFYCNGRTKLLLNDLGFPRVQHEPRDFWKDVDNGTVPPHDTLITNPPYSEDHKERCLSFALEQLKSEGRPFFILMPNYVAARDYFRRLLLANPEAGLVYVIPSTPYEYDHPEGTGHGTSPFDSIWFCGLGAYRVEQASRLCKKHWDESDTTDRPGLIATLNELERLKLIPTTKRPNPRQRRKRRKQAMEAAASASTVTTNETTISTSPQQRSSKKKSRHRNGKGERKRRRF